MTIVNRAFVNAIVDFDDWDSGEYVDEHVGTQTQATLSAAADELLELATNLEVHGGNTMHNYEQIMDKLETLINNGLSVEDVNLSDAIMLEKEGIAKLLIKKGAKLTFDIIIRVMEYSGKKSIRTAITSASKKVLNSVDNNGDSLLHIGLRFGLDYDVLEVLLQRGVDVNKKNSDGDTPLDIALSLTTSYETVPLLVANKAKITSTQLFDSVRESRYVLKNLIANVSKTLIRQQNVEGNSLLHAACATKNADAVKLLIEAGATVNALNKKKETPLHVAYKNNFSGGISMLENANASNDYKDVSGKLPRDYAQNGQDVMTFLAGLPIVGHRAVAPPRSRKSPASPRSRKSPASPRRRKSSASPRI